MIKKINIILGIYRAEFQYNYQLINEEDSFAK